MSQGAFEFAEEHTYAVGELASAINAQLRRGFSDGLWVRGEIQGLRGGGPHRYFRLVEADGDRKSVISVSLFAPVLARLRPLLAQAGLELADGLAVRVRGTLDFYAPSGSLGLKMTAIDTRYTVGELAQERAQTVRRLVAAGLYDANRRLTLTPVPLRVGVVTSADSAAWADFRTEIEASGIGFRLRLIDARVQGERAVPMVSAGVRTLGRCDDLDVVVIIRGGGARSELATFDSEQIATAIARCGLPVFTGLGHEIDTTIADEVAHRRCKTPTAVATELVAMVRAFQQSLAAAEGGIRTRATSHLAQHVRRVDRGASGIRHRVISALDRADERLDVRVERLRRSADLGLEASRRRLTDAVAALGRVPARLAGEERHLDSVAARVRLVDPVQVLARGWSITRDASGRTVRDASMLAAGDTMTTTLANGTVTSTVASTAASAATDTVMHSDDRDERDDQKEQR